MLKESMLTLLGQPLENAVVELHRYCRSQGMAPMRLSGEILTRVLQGSPINVDSELICYQYRLHKRRNHD